MADSPSPWFSPTEYLSRFFEIYPTFIQDKINFVFDTVDVAGVVQFWLPVKTTTGRWLLTTSDQPFAIQKESDGGQKYRSCSVRYRYNLDMSNPLEVEEDPTIITNGAPARAFLNQTPELVPDLRVQGTTRLESSASQCGLFCSVVLPVFDSTRWCCVGVVECTTRSCHQLDYMFKVVTDALQREILHTYHAYVQGPYGGDLRTSRHFINVKDTIEKALLYICPEFCLDLVQVWIAYKDKKLVAFSSSLEEDGRTEQMLGLKWVDHIRDHESYDDDNVSQCFTDYSSLCSKIPLKIGEGLIGRTLKNHKPHFIKKVSKLSDNQPLMLVRHNHFESDPFECSCFVICLRNTNTGDFDYVFEFLWHEVPSYAIMLESLLLSLKRCLPNFMYASGGELGDELPIIYVEDSTKSKTQYFRIFKGNKSSEALKERSGVVKDRLTPLEARCNTNPISLSREGMIDAAENLDVSFSTMKRKRKDQTETNEEDKGAFQDPSTSNNRVMYLDEITLTIKVEYADDLIKFTLPISSATFSAIQKEINKGFALNPGNYKLKYLDEDGDWILLKCDEDMKVCIKGRRNLSSVVRMRLLPTTTTI